MHDRGERKEKQRFQGTGILIELGQVVNGVEKHGQGNQVAPREEIAERGYHAASLVEHHPGRNFGIRHPIRDIGIRDAVQQCQVLGIGYFHGFPGLLAAFTPRARVASEDNLDGVVHLPMHADRACIETQARGAARLVEIIDGTFQLGLYRGENIDDCSDIAASYRVSRDKVRDRVQVSRYDLSPRYQGLGCSDTGPAKRVKDNLAVLATRFDMSPHDVVWLARPILVLHVHGIMS